MGSGDTNLTGAISIIARQAFPHCFLGRRMAIMNVSAQSALLESASSHPRRRPAIPEAWSLAGDEAVPPPHRIAGPGEAHPPRAGVADRVPLLPQSLPIAGGPGWAKNRLRSAATSISRWRETVRAGYA